MPVTQSHFSTTARQDIQRGVDKLANAVKITLGLRGRHVVLDQAFGSPLSTKDGVTVAMVQDIAVLTRGQVLSEDLGVKLANSTLRDLGRAKRVTITKETKKARLEDALHATRAAVEEGVVPGGGLAYIRALPALERLQLGGDRQVGVNVIKRALEEPMRQIACNAGAEGTTVVQRVKAASDVIGYDAAAGVYVNLMDACILNPTKVSRTALQHAASVVGLLLTTEVLIAEVP